MARGLLSKLLVLMLMILADIPGNNDAAASKVTQLSDQSEHGGGEPPAGETGNPIVADWREYTNPRYGFRIRYQNGFVVQPQDVSKLPPFTPRPVASIFFMNPTMARGNLAGIEPPDLEVRVYQAGKVDSLKSWLVSVGFIDNGAAVQPYRNASVNGLKVCQSTMIAPGCSVYVLRKGFVYQITSISREGESMIETFGLLP